MEARAGDFVTIDLLPDDFDSHLRVAGRSAENWERLPCACAEAGSSREAPVTPFPISWRPVMRAPPGQQPPSPQPPPPQLQVSRLAIEIRLFWIMVPLRKRSKGNRSAVALG